MALFQTLCSSFKQESWLAIHDLDTDVLKMALYTSAASLGEDTTVYTTTDEVVGTGYTAGGVVLTNVQVLLSGTTAYCTFDNPAWPGSSFVARGGLIYNTSKADRAIEVRHAFFIHHLAAFDVACYGRIKWPVGHDSKHRYY